ncbi:transcription factor bHLH128-like [Argentina anserina]|uniref:transcription factor bHLH128-like n=1 Tax=Argentina anserina TaxID=57926 RepID=UPI0021767948|nr:transcription factor bHLH128-like [Potentilla anserina]
MLLEFPPISKSLTLSQKVTLPVSLFFFPFSNSRTRTSGPPPLPLPATPSSNSMYPSSSSSSPQKPMGPSPTGLTRYGSAPGSLITSAVDSVIGPAAEREFSSLRPASFVGGRYFPGGGGDGESSDLTSSESTFKVNGGSKDHAATKPLLRSYNLGEMAAAIGSSSSTSCSSSALVRQRSSPAGFLSHLTDNNGGFSVTRGTGSYSSQGGPNGGHGHGVTRLKSQLSFTRQDSLSQISEVSENAGEGVSSNSGHHSAMHSYPATSFGMDSWENTNSIVFSAPPRKRAKNMDSDMFNCLNTLESQFSLPQTTLEMATVEKLLHIPEDSVPCKIRAKRGCATHPRSIAERERRTRISGKLKKLQDLVPNMDKQTSYADMLDLAVQHIKGLQNQVQNLHKDLEGCTCGCKPST